MNANALRGAMALLAMSALAPAARAQATANAIESAEDAFGVTDGAESIGIYDQSSVRGFDLEAAGNFRVNGAYFVKSSGVSSFFLERTLIRVGYSALFLDFPGPSGVVDFSLRDPDADDPSLLTIGVDPYSQTFAEALFRYRSDDGAFSASLGVGHKIRMADEQGGSGRDAIVAGTLRWTPRSDVRLQVFGGEYGYERDGRFRITLAPDSFQMPDRIRRGEYLGQDWAEEQGRKRILGGLSQFELGDGWSLRANAVFSQDDPSNRYLQLFNRARADGGADSAVIASPAQQFTAYSGEARLGWMARLPNATHDIGATVRGRASRNSYGGERVYGLGHVELGEPIEQTPAPTTLPEQALSADEIDQWGVGLGYRFAWRDRVRLNVGVLRTDYTKATDDGAGAQHDTHAGPLLYNGAAAVRLDDDVEVYASVTRGLEEAGAAPATAANRNALLPAQLVTQREVGLRYLMGPNLTVLLAGFDTQKPLAGIAPVTNAYEIVGEVRHRGFEVSVSGALSENLSVVAGAVYTNPEVSGEGVDDGLRGERAVGVPDWRIVANANYTVPHLRGLSIDVGLEYLGERAARAALGPDGRQMLLPADIVADAGLRFRFDVGGRRCTLRAQALNVTSSYAWRVNSAEAFAYSPQRSARVVLTAEF